MAIASKPPKSETRQRFSATAGVVGVDINADHLAVAETDRFGNLLAQFSVPCITDGKSVDQRLEAVRLAAKAVVEHAARVGKPIVHEELDFRVRKQALRESDGPRYARMLSSFAYGSLLQALQSCALRHQVPTQRGEPGVHLGDRLDQVCEAPRRFDPSSRGAHYRAARRGVSRTRTQLFGHSGWEGRSSRL